VYRVCLETIPDFCLTWFELGSEHPVAFFLEKIAIIIRLSTIFTHNLNRGDIDSVDLVSRPTFNGTIRPTLLSYYLSAMNI